MAAWCVFRAGERQATSAGSLKMWRNLIPIGGCTIGWEDKAGANKWSGFMNFDLTFLLPPAFFPPPSPPPFPLLLLLPSSLSPFPSSSFSTSPPSPPFSPAHTGPEHHSEHERSWFCCVCLQQDHGEGGPLSRE